MKTIHRRECFVSEITKCDRNLSLNYHKKNNEKYVAIYKKYRIGVKASTTMGIKGYDVRSINKYVLGFRAS